MLQPCQPITGKAFTITWTISAEKLYPLTCQIVKLGNTPKSQVTVCQQREESQNCCGIPLGYAFGHHLPIQSQCGSARLCLSFAPRRRVCHCRSISTANVGNLISEMVESPDLPLRAALPLWAVPFSGACSSILCAKDTLCLASGGLIAGARAGLGRPLGLFIGVGDVGLRFISRAAVVLESGGVGVPPCS